MKAISLVYLQAKKLHGMNWVSTWHKQAQTFAMTQLQTSTAQSDWYYSLISQQEELVTST